MATNDCCPTNIPGVVSDYTPKGSNEKVGDLDAYFAGSSGSKLGVIIAPDIFGNSPQVKQVCDVLAEAGFQCIAPDYWAKSNNGKVWELSNFPPADRNVFLEWLHSVSYETCVPIIDNALNFLSSRGCTKFAFLGFCWGGSIGMHAAQTGRFSAYGSAHPSFLNPEDMKKIKCPAVLCPSKDDDQVMEGIREALDATPYGSDSIIEKFSTMHHGFCAGRADWNNPENVECTTKALNLFANSFKKHMK